MFFTCKVLVLKGFRGRLEFRQKAYLGDILYILMSYLGLIEVTKSERPEVEKAYQEALQILTNHDEIVSLRQHMDEQMQRLDSLRNKLEVHLGSLQSEVKEFDTSTKGSEEET